MCRALLQVPPPVRPGETCGPPTPPHLNQSPQGAVGLPGPPVWVPGIVFVNTPNTDLTITDTKASLNIRKLGQYSVSTLDNVEQVRSLLVI